MAHRAEVGGQKKEGKDRMNIWDSLSQRHRDHREIDFFKNQWDGRD